MNPKKIKGRHRDENFTPLDKHQREKKKLIPPFNTIPDTKLASWSGDRLPELLWAVLIFGNTERSGALSFAHRIFDAVATHMKSVPEGALPAFDATLSGLASDVELLNVWTSTLASSQTALDALAPMSVLTGWPGEAALRPHLPTVPPLAAWQALGQAVVQALAHQERVATDARWLRVCFFLAAGRMHIPPEMGREFAGYPNEGDQRKVRPSIRAAEGVMDGLLQSPRSSGWAEEFWRQCLHETPCWPLALRGRAQAASTVGITRAVVDDALAHVKAHAASTRTTTAVDDRHEISFGTALYVLRLLDEVLALGNSRSVMARMALRSVAECAINLEYLAALNDPALWRTFRLYGAGQVKLTFLKGAADQAAWPSSIDVDLVQTMASEDVWQEFVDIDLGHWQNSNLRQLSVDASAKDVYDAHYAWTSGFVHGHWGALRYSVLDVCGNPLHRLHRIPPRQWVPLDDVVADVSALVDRVLSVLGRLYPPFNLKLQHGSGHV